MNKRILLVGLLSSLFLLPVQAQQSGALEEIVVTARKRSETLQEVPLAVTVVSGIEIEKLSLQDVTDLYGRVPGLYFAKGSITNPTTSNNYLIIRGIGWNAGLEPSVGVFVDGMYLPQIGYDLSFLDVERLEVLRGPQGTLFGRNTQGGALNIVTRKPDETLRGNVRAEYADFESWRASGSFAGPTAENVFAGVSLDYAKTDGFIRNAVTGDDAIPSERVSGRAVVRWTPTDDLELMVIGDASIKSFNEMVRGVPIGAESYDTFADQEGDDETSNSGVQLNIDYGFGNDVSLTSITGYRKAEADIWIDTDSRVTDQTINIVPATPPFTTGPVANQGAATPYVQDADYLSQELRLSGTGGRFDWQVGGYYFKQDESQFLRRFLTAGVAFPFGVYLNQTYFTNRDGWAAFGQVSYRPVEKLELTVGGRHSDEDIHFGGQRFQFTTAPTTFFPDSTSSADNLSFMGSVSYQFTPQFNIYATYAEGWKAGGFNRLPSNITNNLAYDDETSTNYELGIKSSSANNRFLLNASLFLIDIKDQQVFNFIAPVGPGGLPTSAIENAVASSVQGVELELVAVATEGLTFAGNVAYNDTEYDDYVRRFSATDQFVMDGLDFENTPETTANVSVTYETPISERNGLEFFLNWRYVGDVVIQDNFIGAAARNQSFIPSYDRLDGRLSLINDAGGWRLTLFCDNILDSFDYTDDTADPYRFALFPRYVKPLEPRQVGVSISKSF